MTKFPRMWRSCWGLQQWQPSITLKDGSQHRIVLEGGSIDVNGAGTLITTEECLLSEVQQRNPGVSREQLETAFGDYLGIEQVIWLDRGTAGDDTHGHVDDITRFIGPSTIVTAVEPDSADYNHAVLAENLARLKASRTPDGKQWTIVELPMPRPVVFRGQRLPASYANFYIANGLVLVPTFHDPNDRMALGILAELFPEREVIGIHAVDLVWGLGALHCMTQQQPAASALISR
jgi:agmatine deiminase